MEELLARQKISVNKRMSVERDWRRREGEVCLQPHGNVLKFIDFVGFSFFWLFAGCSYLDNGCPLQINERILLLKVEIAWNWHLGVRFGNKTIT